MGRRQWRSSQQSMTDIVGYDIWLRTTTITATQNYLLAYTAIINIRRFMKCVGQPFQKAVTVSDRVRRRLGIK